MDLDPRSTSFINTGTMGALAASGGTAINIIQQVFSGFASEMLHGPIRTILEAFRQGNTDIAKGQLQLLRSIGGHDPRIMPALEVVSVYLNLDCDDTGNARHQLTTFLAQSAQDPCTLLHDLSRAALLRVAIRAGDAEAEIRTLWNSFSSPGPYAKETFYSSIATCDELKERLLKEGPTMPATELRGVVEGALRLLQVDLAEKAISLLLKYNQDPSTLFLKLCVNSGKLQSATERKHYWLTSAAIHDDLISLASDCADLFLLNPSVDSRLPIFAASLMLYTHGEVTKLVEACWKNIRLIEEVNKECAGLLHYKYEHDPSHLSNLQQKLIKAQKDFLFRSAWVEEILAKKVITTEEGMILVNLAEPRKIKQWMGEGGECENDEIIAKDFVLLCLIASAVESPKERKEVKRVNAECEKFLEQYEGKLGDVNAEPFMALTNQLSFLGLGSKGTELLRALLPQEDFWLSPTMQSYLFALGHAEKNATLASVLTDLPREQWNRETYLLQARLELMAGHYPDARASLETAISFGAIPQLITGLVEVLHHLGNDADIPKVLEQVPDVNLKHEDQHAHRIIIEKFKFGFLGSAESIIVRWFLASPESSAIPITNIFNTLIHLGIDFGKSSSDLKGVQYFDGKSSLTKLIVAPEQAKGAYLLSSSSPLGERLLAADIGESFKEGLITYKLEERMPAMVVIYRIALYIRDMMNEGNDSFHMMTVPADPLEFLGQLTEIMATGREVKQQLCENPSLPIMFKGHMLGGANPFETSLSLLLSALTPKNVIFGFDVNDPSDPLLLDIYSVAYLAISGFVTALVSTSTQIYITVETQYIIQEWLKDRQKLEGGMLTTLSNGVPFLVTKEELKLQTNQIATQVVKLINAAEIIFPAITDLPAELKDCRDCLDSSVFSSMRVAMSRNVKWLCIDFAMAKMADSIGCKVLKNTGSFLVNLCALTPFKYKRDALYLYSNGTFPFPLTYSDLLQLGKDDNEYAIAALYKILIKYPEIFHNAGDPQGTLCSLFIIVFGRVMISGKLDAVRHVNDLWFPKDLERFANACFAHASFIDNNQYCEVNLASFFYRTTYNITANIGDHFSRRAIAIISELVSEYIFGHFLSFKLVDQHIDLLVSGINIHEHRSKYGRRKR